MLNLYVSFEGWNEVLLCLVLKNVIYEHKKICIKHEF